MFVYIMFALILLLASINLITSPYWTKIKQIIQLSRDWKHFLPGVIKKKKIYYFWTVQEKF